MDDRTALQIISDAAVAAEFPWRVQVDNAEVVFPYRPAIGDSFVSALVEVWIDGTLRHRDTHIIVNPPKFADPLTRLATVVLQSSNVN